MAAASSSSSSFPLLRPLWAPRIPSSTPKPTLSFPPSSRPRLSALGKSNNSNPGSNPQIPKKNDVEEVEEDVPWIEEKALDLVEFTGTVAHAIPGPRVAGSKLPWLLAVPLAYVGVTFVFAVVKTARKFTSPRAKKKRMVNKNATLLRSIDELFSKGKEVQHSDLKDLMEKTSFSMDDILRKYIRYALNEKPFNPDVVMELISLRKASQLDDPQVAEVLNEVSRRIVKDKGPVVMDISGFTEKGFKRKLAVQGLFGKILYLSELPEFCSRDGSLVVKEIFGVTDEDAATLRIHTLSEGGDVDSLEKMIDGSDSEEPTDTPSHST